MAFEYAVASFIFFVFLPFFLFLPLCDKQLFLSVFCPKRQSSIIYVILLVAVVVPATRARIIHHPYFAFFFSSTFLQQTFLSKPSLAGRRVGIIYLEVEAHRCLHHLFISLRFVYLLGVVHW